MEGLLGEGNGKGAKRRSRGLPGSSEECCRKRGGPRGNGQCLSLKGSLGLGYRDPRPSCQDPEQAKVLPEHRQAHAMHLICQGPKGRLLLVPEC